MAWVYLLIAGILETVFAVSLKYSEGFTRLWPTVSFAIASVASFFFLSQALRTLPVGIAYAVWTGIGAAGTAIAGMILLGESREVMKLVSLLFLLGGVVGLRLSEGH